MNVSGVPYRTIWLADNGWAVSIIDQTQLPHRFVIVDLVSLEDACVAIKSMQVRGAPLIGVTAAYGMALALRLDATDHALERASEQLIAARPTAVNLAWAVNRITTEVKGLPVVERAPKAYQLAAEIADEDVGLSEAMGDHGKDLIADIHESRNASKPDQPVNILTHCNAGWLAAVDWGTALAPIYKAHDAGIPVHVWVDETRPRNQGSRLTAWELASHNVPHTVITDNSGGHLMQHGLVDICIVGTDRTTRAGDVCNKIGTYLKALAANDNSVPFYVCAPSSSIDWAITDGSQIDIEQRGEDEVRKVDGFDSRGELVEVTLFSDDSPIRNDAFDVTPARLVTGLITERGVAKATEAGLEELFPDKIL